MLLKLKGLKETNRNFIVEILKNEKILIKINFI
jgi:hypothetical protein